MSADLLDIAESVNQFFKDNVADIPTADTIQWRSMNSPENDPQDVTWVQLFQTINSSSLKEIGCKTQNTARFFGFLYFEVRGQLQRGLRDDGAIGVLNVSSKIKKVFSNKIIPIVAGNLAGGIRTRIATEGSLGKQKDSSPVMVKVEFWVDEFIDN